jgi:hypothetical protein
MNGEIAPVRRKPHCVRLPPILIAKERYSNVVSDGERLICLLRATGWNTPDEEEKQKQNGCERCD